MNVEGLKECRYSVHPWSFNEIVGGEETSKWKALNPRFWLISFNDVMIASDVYKRQLIHRDAEGGPQHRTLLGALPD